MTTKENIIQYIGVENTPNTDLYFIYGRMNPMHKGHLGLVRKLIHLATEAKLASGNRNVKVRIFLSTSWNNKNPLTPLNKVKHAKKVLDAYNLNLNSLGHNLNIDIKIMPLDTPASLLKYKQTQLHMLMGQNRWIKKIRKTNGPMIRNNLVNVVETSIKNNNYNSFRDHIIASGALLNNANIRGLFNHARRTYLEKPKSKLVFANFDWLVKRNQQKYLGRNTNSMSATKVREAARKRNLTTLKEYYDGKLNNAYLTNLMNKIQASNEQRLANTPKPVNKRNASTPAARSSKRSKRLKGINSN